MKINDKESLPLWECGLKLLKPLTYLAQHESLPLWECGLKSKSHTQVVLCQDLVQVKMRNFSHFNLPKAQP